MNGQAPTFLGVKLPKEDTKISRKTIQAINKIKPFQLSQCSSGQLIAGHSFQEKSSFFFGKFFPFPDPL
jgi:hypothetical protein